MTGKLIGRSISFCQQYIPTISTLLLTTIAVCGQSTPTTSQPVSGTAPATAQATPNIARPIGDSTQPPSTTTAIAPTVSEADAVQKRMDRARALAAAHQLTAAASELETIRASVKDQMLRNVSSLMLMGIYLEDGNYARAESMLEETFRNRSAKNEASVRTYFALSGQAVIGARAHLGRYRTFGINISSATLPPEAANDLDRLRSLLERLTAQTKELIQANPKDNDAFALLEDVAGIRASLARSNDDRVKWENEYSAARARLATLPTEIASRGGNDTMTSADAESTTRGTSPNSGLNDQAQATKSETPAGTPTIPTTTSSPAGGNAAATTAKTGTSSIVEVGSLAEKATKKVVPVYPQMARNIGASGLVRIKVIVDESGSVAGINWIEGPLALRQAAQDAVRQWKFQPTLMDGKPVRVAGYIDFGFSH